MSKLKDMISSVTEGTTNLQPNIIARDINFKYNEKVTPEQVSDFLQEQFYPEEIQKLEARHKGFDGKFYM